MAVALLTVSQLIGLAEPGPAAGRCYLCGQETTAGHPGAPSEIFTAWSSVYSGTVICEYCWPLASWSWRDVWAYIVANDLPYLPEFADVGNEPVDNVLHWRWRHDDPSQSGTHGRRVREDGGMT
jgi:hypothetical protein